jgi:Tfp pilus assembly protein PilN
MREINLLPWRSLQREREKKWFQQGLLWVGILSVLWIGLVHYYCKIKIAHQWHINQDLKHKIAILDTQILEVKTLKKALGIS